MYQSLATQTAAHERWIGELSAEKDKLIDRVNRLERDRELLERIHAIEIRLERMETTAREHRR